MRIALISSSFAPYIGGVEEHTRQVADHLLAEGHEVEVWTVDRGEHLGELRMGGVPIRYLPTPLPARRLPSLVHFATSQPRAWRAWTRAWREFRPQVLHVQCFGPNGLYALALHARRRTPLVLSSHGETFTDDHGVFDQSRLLNSGLRRAGRAAAAVTGCSSLVVRDLAAHFGIAEAIVVPNGVDLGPDRGGEAHRPAAWPAGPTILAVGRLERVKGFDLLLRAFAAMPRPGGANLIIAGTGSQLEDLRCLADHLGVADRVVFAGRMTPEEVASAMSAATVVAVPSRMEAFGIVVLEAWRSGRPLVATSRGGPGTLVTDDVDGLLVDPDDCGAFAAALHRVVADERLARRLGAAGRRTVEKYTWDAAVDKYVAIYGEAVSRRATPRRGRVPRRSAPR